MRGARCEVRGARCEVRGEVRGETQVGLDLLLHCHGGQDVRVAPALACPAAGAAAPPPPPASAR